MLNTQFERALLPDTILEIQDEIRDMSAVAAGFLSLGITQMIMLFEHGNPTLPLLAHACRAAVAEEQALMPGYTPPAL